MLSARRRGFTLIELLMVVLIIGMLVALLFPAVNSARESSRRTVCLQKMRQLATAVQQYEINHKHYPGWLNMFVAGANQIHNTSWTVLALPYLERNDVFESLKQDGPTPGNLVTLRGLLVCPSDFDKMAATGPVTSFVGNTGRMDQFELAEQNGVPADWRTNGVFLHVHHHQDVSTTVM